MWNQRETLTDFGLWFFNVRWSQTAAGHTDTFLTKQNVETVWQQFGLSLVPAFALTAKAVPKVVNTKLVDVVATMAPKQTSSRKWFTIQVTIRSETDEVKVDVTFPTQLN